MAMKKNNNVERIFIWRFNTKKQAATFQNFVLRSVVSGESVQDNLLRMVEKFNETNTPDFTPVTEADMLQALHKKKFKTTRQSLKNMRDRGDLDGLWFTDGKSIVYNKESVLDLIKKRKAA